MSDKIKHFYEFDEFRLDAETPGLWRDGKLVPIFPKALEILVLLVNKKGAIVSRNELLETVWKNTFVEEANITFAISVIRKMLDEHDKKHFIQTVSKRGYRFVADVREVSETVQSNGLSRDSAAIITPQAVTLNPPKAQIRWHFIAIILLGVLLLTSFAAWWNFSDQQGLSSIPVGKRNIRTVAILPLKTLTEGEQSKAMALGLTDSLISRLGSLNRFAVRPLNSVKGYAESDQDPLKFGETLKVDAVLEGTLQQTENRLRVSVRLWDVRDGAQIWQDSFDSAEAEFFNLQDTISTRVTQSLVSQVIEKDRQLLTVRDTENRAAYYAYWRGRFLMESSKPKKAIAEFEQAVNLDPNYAAGFAGLADAYSQQAQLTTGANAELYQNAEAFANRALELNPNLPDAHLSLGRIKFWRDWDWASAEQYFKRAIELDPNDSVAHNFYARLLSVLSRYDESLAEINKAREINPRSTVLAFRHLAILERRGDFDEAAKIARKAMETDPNEPFVARTFGSISLLTGDYAKVIESGSKIFPNPQNTNHVWASFLATAYHKTGQTAKAEEMLNHLKKLAKKDSKALYFLAMSESEFGHTDKAIAALQKCLELREELLIWTKDEPRFANLKNDARFQEILRKMNLAN